MNMQMDRQTDARHTRTSHMHVTHVTHAHTHALHTHMHGDMDVSTHASCARTRTHTGAHARAHTRAPAPTWKGALTDAWAHRRTDAQTHRYTRTHTLKRAGATCKHMCTNVRTHLRAQVARNSCTHMCTHTHTAQVCTWRRAFYGRSVATIKTRVLRYYSNPFEGLFGVF